MFLTTLFQGLFAAANIFSSLKLVYIFSVNPYLGPLQVREMISVWKNKNNVFMFFFVNFPDANSFYQFKFVKEIKTKLRLGEPVKLGGSW